MNRRTLLGLALASLSLMSACASSGQPVSAANNPGEMTMTKRILIAMTSHAEKGNTGQPTGAYLAEIAHPFNVFQGAGYEVEFASVKGGRVPLDGVKEADAEGKAFLDKHAGDLEKSMAADKVDPNRYDAIFYAGGHGAMWDLPDDPAFQRVAAAIYERGGVVAAVCHGPAALVNIKLSDGSYLVAGKHVSAFTNEEESAVKLEKVVPFLLADKLQERGAVHEGAPNWQRKVVISGRLVTGQNPASAAGTAEGVVSVIEKR